MPLCRLNQFLVAAVIHPLILPMKRSLSRTVALLEMKDKIHRPSSQKDLMQLAELARSRRYLPKLHSFMPKIPYCAIIFYHNFENHSFGWSNLDWWLKITVAEFNCGSGHLFCWDYVWTGPLQGHNEQKEQLEWPMFHVYMWMLL